MAASGRFGGTAGGATCGVQTLPVVGRAGTAPRGGLPGVWPAPGLPSCGVVLRRGRSRHGPARGLCATRFLLYVTLSRFFFVRRKYMMMDPNQTDWILTFRYPHDVHRPIPLSFRRLYRHSGCQAASERGRALKDTIGLPWT